MRAQANEAPNQGQEATESWLVSAVEWTMFVLAGSTTVLVTRPLPRFQFGVGGVPTGHLVQTGPPFVPPSQNPGSRWEQPPE